MVGNPFPLHCVPLHCPAQTLLVVPLRAYGMICRAACAGRRECDLFGRFATMFRTEPSSILVVHGITTITSSGT